MLHKKSAVLRGIAIAVAVVGVAASARAEAPAAAPAADPRVADFLRSKEMREAIAKGVHQQVTSQPVECKDIKIAGDSRFRLLSPIEFTGEGKIPSKGQWIETMTVNSCGVERKHNIQSAVVDGKVQMIGRLNGTSVASLTLQRDAVTIAETAAVQHAGEGCSKTAVIDTDFKGFEGGEIAGAKDGPKARLWREDWTVWACGKQVLLPMIFTPDAEGTPIAAKAGEASVK